MPAGWVLVGVATALFGLVPRATGAAWAVLGACVLVGMLGVLLGLPRWVMDLSPFQHTPLVPAAELTVAPLVALVSVAAVLIAAGLRRRDVG